MGLRQKGINGRERRLLAVRDDGISKYACQTDPYTRTWFLIHTQSSEWLRVGKCAEQVHGGESRRQFLLRGMAKAEVATQATASRPACLVSTSGNRFKVRESVLMSGHDSGVRFGEKFPQGMHGGSFVGGICLVVWRTNRARRMRLLPVRGCRPEGHCADH